MSSLTSSIRASRVSVRHRCEELIVRYGGVRKAADRVGINPSYFIKVRDGKRLPSRSVLKAMGLKMIISYRRDMNASH